MIWTAHCWYINQSLFIITKRQLRFWCLPSNIICRAKREIVPRNVFTLSRSSLICATFNSSILIASSSRFNASASAILNYTYFFINNLFQLICWFSVCFCICKSCHLLTDADHVEPVNTFLSKPELRTRQNTHIRTRNQPTEHIHTFSSREFRPRTCSGAFFAGTQINI